MKRSAKVVGGSFSYPGCGGVAGGGALFVLPPREGEVGSVVAQTRGDIDQGASDWKIHRARYLAMPVMSDGSDGPQLELRGLFEQFLLETQPVSGRIAARCAAISGLPRKQT